MDKRMNGFIQMNGWVYTFHQIGFIPTELNMVSDGFNLDFSPHQIRFILMISNLFGRQVEFMLMISNLLSLSTWIYSCYFHWWSQFLFQLTTFWWLQFFWCDSSNCLFAGEYWWVDGFGWMEEWIHMDRWF